MPTNTYVALATQTIGTATSSVTFSPVATGYTDLVVVVDGTVTGNVVGIGLRFNSDTGTNYSDTSLTGTGSSANSGRNSNQTFSYIGYSGTAGNRFVTRANIMNYSNATTNKTVLARHDQPAEQVIAWTSMWRNTAAITSVTVLANGANFATGTTVSLYGIAAASVGAKATGGTIYSDASYYYHVFAGNGTFTPTQSLSVDVLALAGGGGGGYHGGGGGGAGGLLYSTSQSLSSGVAYTATIGAGGAGGYNGGHAADGANSTLSGSGFTTLTASAGGGAGGYLSTPYTGNAGGSGGGGWGTYSGGNGVSGQGNNGGAGAAGGGYNEGAGGGGGAGAVGAGAVGGVSQGNGGVGSSAYASWSTATGIGQLVSGTYYLAGGGGGGMAGASSATFGTGGYGGGGAGANKAVSVNGTNGTTNLGGGGGGGAYNGTPGSIGTPGNGGSGVIIVRYAK